MNENNINNASDKLNIIDDKIGFLTNMVLYINLDNYQFDENDLTGFGLILSDLQEEVKEVKKLLGKN